MGIQIKYRKKYLFEQLGVKVKQNLKVNKVKLFFILTIFFCKNNFYSRGSVNMNNFSSIYCIVVVAVRNGAKKMYFEIELGFKKYLSFFP